MKCFISTLLHDDALSISVSELQKNSYKSIQYQERCNQRTIGCPNIHRPATLCVCLCARARVCMGLSRHDPLCSIIPKAASHPPSLRGSFHCACGSLAQLACFTVSDMNSREEAGAVRTDGWGVGGGWRMSCVQLDVY